MHTIFGKLSVFAAFAAVLIAVAGCGDDSDSTDASTGGDDSASSQNMAQSPNAGGRSFKPVNLDGSTGANGKSRANLTAEQKAQMILDRMQPLQVVLGTWRGTTRRKFGRFSSVEEVEWVWDFQTDETQPSLVMSTTTSPYLKSGRLTYLLDEGKYEFTAVDKEGVELRYVGRFTQEPRDVSGSDGQPTQRQFKLELARESEQPEHKLARLVFNQQENNRYLLELYDQRDFRYDTLANQREGTSFAVSEDYGEKECIISQGLGTISIPYNGKTYWVCCSGCAAAFKEDPEKWIAKAAAREKMKK